jgi:hypothetical protein
MSATGGTTGGLLQCGKPPDIETKLGMCPPFQPRRPWAQLGHAGHRVHDPMRPGAARRFDGNFIPPSRPVQAGSRGSGWSITCGGANPECRPIAYEAWAVATLVSMACLALHRRSKLLNELHLSFLSTVVADLTCSCRHMSAAAVCEAQRPDIDR